MEQKSLNPFTVLLVDDEDHVVCFIRIRLRAAGYRVLSAQSGFAALQFLKNYPVDAAIVDLMMPGMGGLDLIKQMRAFTQIPVIVLTAMDCPETKYKAIAAGANDFLTKPFNPDEIVARVDQIRASQKNIK
jgi:two-component system KDP operon response regulator KdpE